jgi:hypothetical protein
MGRGAGRVGEEGRRRGRLRVFNTAMLGEVVLRLGKELQRFTHSALITSFLFCC